MLTPRSTLVLLAVAALTASGCAATRFGKCRECESNAVYPTQPYYETSPHTYDSLSVPPSQPAPVPAAEPLPLPPAGEPVVPPPPAQAVRARPIDQISATTRGWYYSASSTVRAAFSR